MSIKSSWSSEKSTERNSSVSSLAFVGAALIRLLEGGTNKIILLQGAALLEGGANLRPALIRGNTVR